MGRGEDRLGSGDEGSGYVNEWRGEDRLRSEGEGRGWVKEWSTTDDYSITYVQFMWNYICTLSLN